MAALKPLAWSILAIAKPTISGIKYETTVKKRPLGAVPRQVDSSNIKKLFSCYFQVRDKLIINFGSPPGLPFLIQALS